LLNFQRERNQLNNTIYAKKLHMWG
jgi:hypothetical protein